MTRLEVIVKYFKLVVASSTCENEVSTVCEAGRGKEALMTLVGLIEVETIELYLLAHGEEFDFVVASVAAGNNHIV